jgi:hypothetical protein
VSIVETPEAANRLARAILSDIRVYNQEKLQEGLRKDTVFQILAEEIEEGRKHYESRVSPELRVRTSFYERAIVDVLIYQSRGIRSQIW